MSFATQSAKRRAFGRSHLHPMEIAYHLPWYASHAWQEKKKVIANRIKRRNEELYIKRLEREDLRKGYSPEEATARREKRMEELQPKSIVTKVLEKIGL